MVTDKNCQIHFIHPAVTLRQPSLGIRDHKREKGKSLDVLQTFRVQETWLRNQKPGPDLLQETYKEYINYTPIFFLAVFKTLQAILQPNKHFNLINYGIIED